MATQTRTCLPGQMCSQFSMECLPSLAKKKKKKFNKLSQIEQKASKSVITKAQMA